MLTSNKRRRKTLLGKEPNILSKLVESSLQQLKQKSQDFEIQKKLDRPALDITLPVCQTKETGALHPVTLVKQKMYKIFHRYGFTVYEGPEIESEHYNFNALNIQEDHPARDMQDTFFVKNGEQMVLRTHTSNVQIHAMLQEKPPLRLISPGRVYRVDNDATHSPMFHQIECVVVDKDINFSHLKGMIEAFMHDIFGSETKVRFRPSFFPFVEPGRNRYLWTKRLARNWWSRNDSP